MDLLQVSQIINCVGNTTFQHFKRPLEMVRNGLEMECSVLMIQISSKRLKHLTSSYSVSQGEKKRPHKPEQRISYLFEVRTTILLQFLPLTITRGHISKDRKSSITPITCNQLSKFNCILFSHKDSLYKSFIPLQLL